MERQCDGKAYIRKRIRVFSCRLLPNTNRTVPDNATLQRDASRNKEIVSLQWGTTKQVTVCDAQAAAERKKSFLAPVLTLSTRPAGSTEKRARQTQIQAIGPRGQSYFQIDPEPFMQANCPLAHHIKRSSTSLKPLSTRSTCSATKNPVPRKTMK